MRQIALCPQVTDLARRRAWFVFSVSGGKDSGSAFHATNAWLDELSHPRDRRLAVHADLGRAEWKSTLPFVRRQCDEAGIRLEVVRARDDLLWRWNDRWRRSLDRYAALQTIKLVSPWSSASLLFCRGEQKLQPISAMKSRLPTDLPIVGVVGIRHEESPKRARTPVSSPDASLRQRHRKEGLLYHPIVHWTAEEVFAHHAAHRIPLHEAYEVYGSSRLSCAYCVIGSANDHGASASSPANTETRRHIVDLEIRSAFSFQPTRWLADLRDDLDIDRAALIDAKTRAEERRRAEEQVPQRVAKAKSISGISVEEAEALASVRRRIAAIYGLNIDGTTGARIRELGEAAEPEAMAA